jgi:hypothetical protein
MRLRAILRRGAHDLDDELTFHLTMREEQLRRSGADEPRVAARRRFGSRVNVCRSGKGTVEGGTGCETVHHLATSGRR